MVMASVKNTLVDRAMCAMLSLKKNTLETYKQVWFFSSWLWLTGKLLQHSTASIKVFSRVGEWEN
jgi:hypothetical protein